MRLSDSKLLRTEAYIDGAWYSNGGRTFQVNNPATGEKLADMPRLGLADTRRAIEAADGAFRDWADRPARERARILHDWAWRMRENAEDLAVLMTAENGKPLKEARGEVEYAASFLEWFGEEAKRVYGDTIPAPGRTSRTVVLKQPVGVAAGITPWNFPSAMITRKAAPALAAGCPVVLKPAEQTPLSATALAELAGRAGVPRGVFNLVLGDADDAAEIGTELSTNPLVRKVSFTGSTEVGKQLMKQASGSVKKLSLELGGNAPFIVFDDADLDEAVKGAVASKFRNSGQTCVCANRFYVQAPVFDEFAERFTAAVRELNTGDGMEEGTHVGPLIDQQGLDKVQHLVSDALANGATALTGGKAHSLGRTFYEPTVLTGVTPEMAIHNTEIFGPVAPLYRFETDEEAIRMANDTDYGLAAYYYARDIGRVWRTAEQLEYGIVGSNTGLISTEAAPFGGMKQSGLGREGSKYGIEEFVEIKYISVAGLGA